MKNLFKVLSLVIAFSACTQAVAGVSVFARRAYLTASAAFGVNSVWQDMQVKKESNQFVPTIKNVNPEKAAVCAVTGLGFVGLSSALIKKGLLNKVPVYGLAALATDATVRTIEHQRNGGSGIPAMPHYTAMKNSAVSFYNMMYEKVRSLIS